MQLQRLLHKDAIQSTHRSCKMSQCLSSTVQRRYWATSKIQKDGHWVPHEISHHNIVKRLEICLAQLSRHWQKFIYIFFRIMTGDENWMCYGCAHPKTGIWDPGQPTTSKPTTMPKVNIHGKKNAVVDMCHGIHVCQFLRVFQIR